MDNQGKVGRELQDKKSTDMVLKKHVGLIHCGNKLTLVQRKICNILLFNALDTIITQDIHEISLRKLCSLVGYNSNDSLPIKASIKKLISVVMEWNLLDDSTHLNEKACHDNAIIWNASALLAGATIKSGVVRYSYSPQMKTVLSSVDIYGRINLFVQAKFNSSYSLVLYENVVRFKNINQTTSFTIDLFRSLMGVSEDKYPSFKEFKRNVVNVAVAEINLKSDIFIEPVFKKTGRNITSIQFLVKENENFVPTFRKINAPKEFQREAIEKSSLMEILTTQYELSEKQAKDIIASYAHEYILEKLELVKTNKNVKHAGAYLIAALKQNYQQKQQIVAKQPVKQVEVSHIRQAKEAHEIRPLKNKYMAYKVSCYLNFMKAQPDSTQKTMREKFEDYLRINKEVYRFYKKSEFSSIFVRSAFITFVDTHYASMLGEILSFDDYIISEESAVAV